MSGHGVLIYEKSLHRAAALRAIAEEAGFSCRAAFYRAEAEAAARTGGFSILVAGFDTFPLSPVLETMRTAVSAPAGEIDKVEALFRKYDIAGPVLTYPYEPAATALALRRMAESAAKKVFPSAGPAAIPSIIGVSDAVREMKQLILKAANASSTVLILGETGTGKELASRALHESGSRNKGPFVAVNCAAIPETLIESELFGHEKGSFTGAYERKAGKFEAAHKGTIFLDEIGELPPAMQVKLLRVLESGVFNRVGGNASVTVDARVVCATNRDVFEMARTGSFRRDLLYRINVIAITLPPLRERPEDIPPLAAHFLKKYALQAGKNIIGFSPAAEAALMAHYWPGNIRQLENAVERAVLHCTGGLIETVMLDPDTRAGVSIAGGPGMEELLDLDYFAMKERVLDHFEREWIAGLLRRHGGQILKVCEISGMDRKTLYRKMKRYGLDKKDFK